MASQSPSPVQDRTEHCTDCERDTQHSISIEIRTESDQDGNARFSREPYRVATCMVCGSEQIQRMNNA